MKEIRVITTSREGVLTGISGSQPITLTIDGEQRNIRDWLEKHLGHTVIIIAVEPLISNAIVAQYKSE